MHTQFIAARPSASGSRGFGFRRIGRFFIDTLVLAFRVSKERRDLAHLTAEQLEDIGISEQAAAEEAQRGFLDTPYSRRARFYL